MAAIDLTDIVYNSDLGSATINSVFTEIENFLNGTTSSADLTITGTLTGASITDSTATLTGGSFTGLTSLTVDDININSNTISSAGASSLTITATAGQNVSVESVTFDGGVVAGASSITSTAFVGTLSTAAQGNITSVGTLSSLAVTGDLTIDTNTLFVDSATNDVGIGTISPLGKLHIKTGESGGATPSSGGDELILEALNSPGITLLGSDIGAGTIAFGDTADSDIGRIVYLHSTNSLLFYTANSTAITINSTQRVGLAMNPTGDRLAVNGSTLITGDLTVDTNTFYVDSTNNRVGIGTASPGALLEIATPTEALRIVDAGSTGSTEQDWAEVEVGGVVGYIRVYATK